MLLVFKVIEQVIVGFDGDMRMVEDQKNGRKVAILIDDFDHLDVTSYDDGSGHIHLHLRDGRYFDVDEELEVLEANIKELEPCEIVRAYVEPKEDKYAYAYDRYIFK